MNRVRYLVLFFIFFFDSNFPISAQSLNDPPDTLAAKIESYHKKNGLSQLYTIFDKNVYVPNESVWLNAYVLDYSKQKIKPTILTVVLVDAKKSIVVQQQYKIAGGLSAGHLYIPSALSPGNYYFITYTNIKTGKTIRDIFIQPISIVQPTNHNLVISLNTLKEQEKSEPDSQKVLLKITDATGRTLPGIAVDWNLGAGKPVISGIVKTDRSGNYLFSIPKSQINYNNQTLKVSVNYLGEEKKAQIILPFFPKDFKLKFFPEGGELVAGAASWVGWEAHTPDGPPAKLKAILYEDQKIIDTIETDQYGMGKFKLNPKTESTYFVRTIGKSTDSLYRLPIVLKYGVALSLQNALLADSLKIIMRSSLPSQYFVVVHNFNQIFYAFPIQCDSKGKQLDVNLEQVPKGLSAITLLDGSGRPCAERIFFAHYKSQSQVDIETDQHQYGTRQKVHIKLKLRSTFGDSILAVATVACVQHSRISMEKQNDIASYTYLKNALEKLPVKENYLGETVADKDYLEKVLLIKGWRKYKWQDLAVSTKDTADVKQTLINLNGQIDRYGQPFKRIVNLMVMTDSTTSTEKSDPNGKFTLDADKISSSEERNVHLLLQYDKTEGFKIVMDSTFRQISDSLARNQILQDINKGVYIDELPSASNVTELKEVKVIGRRNDVFAAKSQPGAILKPTANECGDWVCRYNILNCPNHYGQPDNTLPIVGHTYSDGGYGTIIYKGCKTVQIGLESTIIKGLYYAKEFYSTDYSTINLTEPDYQSTLFWKPSWHLNSKKEMDFSFYTNDLTGLFQVIVQGVSSKDLFYQTAEFEVKKK